MHKIGRYKIIKEIGEGSLAVVYLAEDPVLNRQVALKVLHPIFSKNKKNLERLRQEAQTLAKLDHPNIIRIYEFLDEPEAKGIVTEYVEGLTLGKFLEKYSPLLPEIGCKIVCDVLEALEHAHSRKIIHRDVKPENIIINNNGQVKLADFSIAKLLDQASMTLTGQLVGSPFYISPEQACGKKADDRSDLFSTGILFYRLVAGKLPFFDEDAASLLKKILSSLPSERPSTFNPQVSEILEQILMKALQKDMNLRFQKAWEFRYEILSYLKSCQLSIDEISLKDFFDNPKEYTQTFKLKLSQHYFQQGLDHFKNKVFIQASSNWNKALEYDPKNKDIHAHIAKISQKKMQFNAKRIGIVVAPLLIIFGISTFFMPKSQQTIGPTKPTATQAKNTPDLKSEILMKENSSWSYLKVNKDDDTFLFIDNRRVFLDVNDMIKLSPGKYNISFRKPGFKDIQANINLKPGETSTINIKQGT